MGTKQFILASLVASIASVQMNFAYSIEQQANMQSDNFIVQDIKVDGLQRVTLGAALLKIPVRIGDRFNVQSDTGKIIKELYASGNFENIQMLQEEQTLVIKVKERPTIVSISFSGNESVKEEQLKASLKASNIQEGEALNRALLRNIEKSLEDFYFSVGKYNSKVEARVTLLERNRADIKFVFTEGPASKIKQINILGNNNFTTDDLLSRINLNADTSWWQFFSDDTYQKQMLAADIEILKSYYLDRGYLKFAVKSSNVSLSPDKNNVYITLEVDEGSVYTIKDIQFKGDVLNQSFVELAQLDVNKIYNGSKITVLEDNIKRTLSELGHAYPTITTIPTFDEEKKEVLLTVNVDPGSRIYVRNIRFTGNTVTKDEVLRREMRQMESSWLNGRLIEDGKANLSRLGFFETVDVQTVRVANTNDQVDVIYNVKEANSGSINFGIGYGTESGLSFLVGFKQENFLGTGNRVGINATTNDYQKNISLEYRDPYWTIDGISFGGQVFYDEFKASDAGIIDYTNESYGLNFTWGFPFNSNNRIEYGLGYVHNKIGDLSPYLQLEQFLIAQKHNLDSDGALNTDDFDINVSWIRNTLNRGYFPTAGNYQQAYYKMTLPGSDVKFFKIQYDIRQYLPLTQDHDFTLLFRGRLAYGNGYGTTSGNDNIYPFYENYYAGGFSSLRGFGVNSVGPRAVYGVSFDGTQKQQLFATDDSVGGNALALASLELVVPTPFTSEDLKHQLRTSVFIDAASVWDTEFNYDPNSVMAGSRYYHDYSKPGNFRYSYGAAVQWISPMGPLVFAVARPIKSFTGDDKEFFTFTIGRTF